MKIKFNAHIDCVMSLKMVTCKDMPIGLEECTQQMSDIANTLQITAMFNQIAPPTPLGTQVNRNTKWTKLT